MCVLGVHSRVKTEGVSEVEPAMEKGFSAIVEPQTEGVRNASIKAANGATIVSLELEKQAEHRKGALAR